MEAVQLMISVTSPSLSRSLSFIVIAPSSSFASFIVLDSPPQALEQLFLFPLITENRGAHFCTFWTPSVAFLEVLMASAVSSRSPNTFMYTGDGNGIELISF